MALRLTLTGDGLGGRPQTRLLSQGSLSLGRGPGNDWVLPDPDRHLSKTHCVVAVERGQYVLTDLSTNGVYVNGASQPTSRDDRILLTDGDDFRLGTYTVRVEDVDDAAASPRGGAAPLHPGAFGADPFGDDPVAARGRDEERSPLDVDPLDDPLGRPPDPAFRHPVAHHPASPRGQDPFDQQDEQRRRDGVGHDVFGHDGGHGGGHGGLGAGLGSDPDADLFRGVAPSPLWQGAAQPDHADAPSHAFAPPKVRHPGPFGPTAGPGPAGDLDFDALIGELPPAAGVRSVQPAPPSAAPPHAFAQPFAPPRPQAHAQPSSVPPPAQVQPSPQHPGYAPAADPFGAEDDLLAPARPAGAAVAPYPAPPAGLPYQAGTPQTAASPAAPPVPAASPPMQPAYAQAAAQAAAPVPLPAAPMPAPVVPQQATQAGGGHAAALAAFMQGAGLDGMPVPPGDPEAALRAAGQVFRAMVEGLREVLMSRAAIKGEMRVEQTMIRARDNNALKFSVTADDAVSALLGANRPGYMPPLNSAREAFADIKSHELAVMAGVQDALVALLRRFDPEALEKRLASGLLDSVLPATRKARLWDGFKQVYGDIAREAEDDFQAVFGREFARAYAAQARKE